MQHETRSFLRHLIGGLGIMALLITYLSACSSGATSSPPGPSQATSGVSGHTPTPAGSGSGAMNQTLNLQFTYTSDEITLTSVQYAPGFPDDARGGVRIAFQEKAEPKIGAVLYGDAFRLLLPDQNLVSPSTEQYSALPAAGTARPNWIDFAVTSQPADLSQLVLRVGTAQENQMLISLHAGADLSKYQPKTVTLNLPIHYGGLNWTLVTATQTLSAGALQATTGMRYVVLTLNVDNPTAGNVNISFVGEYMRLKSGEITTKPVSAYERDSTLPTTIMAHQTGVSGTVTFLMPENDSTFTLMFLVVHSLADPVSAVQVNTDFTIA